MEAPVVCTDAAYPRNARQIWIQRFDACHGIMVLFHRDVLAVGSVCSNASAGRVRDVAKIFGRYAERCQCVRGLQGDPPSLEKSDQLELDDLVDHRVS